MILGSALPYVGGLVASGVAIVALDLVGGSLPYLDWVRETVALRSGAVPEDG